MLPLGFVAKRACRIEFAAVLSDPVDDG